MGARWPSTGLMIMCRHCRLVSGRGWHGDRDVLFGDYNPEGVCLLRDKSVDQLPPFTDYSRGRTYRYFKEPLPVCLGLSYTKFQYGKPGSAAELLGTERRYPPRSRMSARRRGTVDCTLLIWPLPFPCQCDLWLRCMIFLCQEKQKVSFVLSSSRCRSSMTTASAD
jgi:hypothetical protein